MRVLGKWAIASLATAMGMYLSSGPAIAQTRLKISSPTINDANQEWGRLFAAGLEKRLPGKFKVEYYPANQLGAIPTTVEGVALGTIEAVLVSSGFYLGLEPRYAIFDIPGIFDNTPHAARIFDDPAIRQSLASFGKAKGVEAVAIYAQAPMLVLSHKAINSVADFNGQKLRVPGGAPLHVEPFRKMGASPLSMPLGEVLPAMQNKTIDGFLAGLTVFPTFKFYDVAKALTYLPSSMIVIPVVMNTGFIDSQGPAVARAIREAAREAERNIIDWSVADAKKAIGVWTANGGQMIQFTDAEKKKYLEEIASVLPPILARNKALQDDHAAFLAAAGKYRQ